MVRNIITSIFLLLVAPYYSQAEDYTIYQDTVFIKSNKDQTGNKIRYGTDTVIFETEMRRHILTGTTVLPSTHNQFSAQWEYGLLLNKVKKSDCQGSAEEIMGNGGFFTEQNKFNHFNRYQFSYRHQFF